MPTTGEADGRRAALVSTLAVGAATVLVLLVAVWAAAAGPDDPFRGDGRQDAVTVTDPEPSELAPAVGEPGEDSEKDDSRWVTVLVAIIIGTIALVIVLAVLGVLVSVLAGLPRPGRRRRAPPEQEPVELAPIDAVSTSMLDDAAAQETALAAGSPRNGIVECWHRFEVQADRAGIPRRSSETSAEFTLRLLDIVEADAAAVSRLSALYREARFSEHDLDESAREAARDALHQVHRDLRGLRDLRRQLSGRVR